MDEPAASGDPQTIKIIAVKGIVRVTTADGKTATPQVGDVLAIDTEVRTGPRSTVVFSVGETQVFTLDRMGSAKFLQAVNDGGKIKTDLGLKYGRAAVTVEAGGAEHETNIHSPSATLAVRGSKAFLEEYKGVLNAGADTGNVSWTRGRRGSRTARRPIRTTPVRATDAPTSHRRTRRSSTT